MNDTFYIGNSIDDNGVNENGEILFSVVNVKKSRIELLTESELENYLISEKIHLILEPESLERQVKKLYKACEISSKVLVYSLKENRDNKKDAKFERLKNVLEETKSNITVFQTLEDREQILSTFGCYFQEIELEYLQGKITEEELEQKQEQRAKEHYNSLMNILKKFMDKKHN